MDTLECLVTRRSVRKYKPDPIPRQELEEILAAAACAPSAVNLQPWYLVAVCSPEGMAEFRDTMRQVAGPSWRPASPTIPRSSGRPRAFW